jgi:type IV secretory pathway TraG/TraD family ATPase VirD4
MGRCYVDLRPETVETAEYISKTLGQSTVQFKTRSEGGKKGSPFSGTDNIGEIECVAAVTGCVLSRSW